MRQFVSKVAFFVLACQLITAAAQAAPPVGKIRGTEPVMLISADEAAQPDAPIKRPKFARADSVPKNGPIISFLKPQDGDAVQKPFPIRIEFKPRESPVNLKSLEVTYLKFIPIDITDRILPYVTAAGVDLPEAQIPEGRHRVRFALSDSAGNRTEALLNVKVSESEEEE